MALVGLVPARLGSLAAGRGANSQTMLTCTHTIFVNLHAFAAEPLFDWLKTQKGGLLTSDIK